MMQTHRQDGEQRRYRTGYIRTRPVPPGYDISWGDVIDKGKAMYEEMRAEMEAKYPGQYVIIDIVSGEYEIDPDEVKAARRLNTRFPDVKPWTVKIAVRDAVDRA